MLSWRHRRPLALLTLMLVSWLRTKCHVCFWHCSRSMRCEVCVTVGCPSVRPSVCLSHLSTAATTAGGFAAERREGRRYPSLAADAPWAPCCRRAGAQQQTRAASRWQPTEEAEHTVLFQFYVSAIVLKLWPRFYIFNPVISSSNFMATNCL